MYRIYTYTDLTTNRPCYVGYTGQTLEKRAGKDGCLYKTKSNFYFGKAIQKYGWQNFRGEVIKEVPTREEALYWESWYIKVLRTQYPNGYNERTKIGSRTVENLAKRSYNFNMNTYYAYTRVSTETQGQKETSLTVQESYLIERAKQLGMNYVVKREVQSGKNLEDRPVLKELLDSVEKGDILGVYDDSRLARSTLDSISIATALTKKGVGLEIAGSIVNITDPAKELSYVINAAVSDYSRKLQNAKAQASIDLLRKKGDMIIAPHVKGYEVVKKRGKTYIEIVPEEAAYVRYIFEELAKGKNITHIAKELKMLYTSIMVMVDNPVYMGYYTDSPEITKQKGSMPRKELEKHLVKSNLYPPIVEEDLWWKVHESYLQTRHIRNFAYKDSVHEITGIYRSPCCGSSVVYMTTGNYNYYSPTLAKKGCTHHKRILFPAERLEFVSKACLFLTLMSGIEIAAFFVSVRDKLLKDVEDVQDKIDGLDIELNEKKKLLTRHKRLLLENKIDADDFADIIKDIKDEIKEKEKEISALKLSLAYRDGLIEEVLKEEAENTVENYLHSNPEDRRDFYMRFVKEAVLYDKKSLMIEFINTKRFIVNDDRFEMYYLDEKQAEGSIKDKIVFDPVTAPDDASADYLNKYYSELAEEVNKNL